MLEWLFAGIEKAKGAKLEHPVARQLPAQAVTDEVFSELTDGTPFRPGGNYFGVRLAGLHVVDARRFTVQQLPLCVCLSEFVHAGQQRGVPFSIGPDVLRQRLKDAGVGTEAKPVWVELRDLTVLTPTPTGAGNLSLFTGLYTVPGDDLARSLLNMVGDLGQSIGGTALSANLKIADTVYTGFGTLLGLNTVNQVVAAFNGKILSRSGYYLLANTTEGDMPSAELEVRDARLYRRGHPVENIDYCLLALECYRSIVDDAKLAPQLFYEPWSLVMKALTEDPAAAGRAFRRLQGAILASPDLIEADRELLMSSYLALYRKREEQLGITEGAAATKGLESATLLMGIAEQAALSRAEGDAPTADRLEQVRGAVSELASQPLSHRDLDAVISGEAVVSTARQLRARIGGLDATELGANVAEALLRGTLRSQ